MPSLRSWAVVSRLHWNTTTRGCIFDPHFSLESSFICRYKQISGEYSGKLLYGRPHGQGHLKCDNGDVIIGQFADGLPHGLAKLISPDGSTYEGNWECGSMSGAGCLQQANGDRYDGMWFRGQRTSSGIQTWQRSATASGSATVR